MAPSSNVNNIVSPQASTPSTVASEDLRSSMNRRMALRLLGLSAGAVSATAVLGSSAHAAKAKPAAKSAAKTPVKATPTTAKAAAAPAASVTSAAAPATPATAKTVRKVKLGFIALTDASPIIMAKELGFFKNRSLDVEVIKQASWPALRDALLTGQIDGAHCLYSMPFSVATKIGGNGSTDLKIAMMLNQNGQAITLARDFKEVGYGDLPGAKEFLESKDTPSLAMTFPGGTHDLWLRYWLAATKADTSKVKISAVPPPQMVQNMSVGNVQAYCVGEPWNAVAVQKGVGFTHLATQDIWQNHPEKALVVNAKFAAETDTLADVMGAVFDACKWLDDLANRSKAADTVSAPQYVNAPAADIRGRLLGQYDFGPGVGTKDFKGDQMQFYRGGAVNFPRKSHAIWAMAQYQRFGLLKEAPNYTKLADELILTDLYAKVAAAEKVAIPSDDMTPFEIKLDKATFDPKNPSAEVTRK
jgi:nitrate/nitrite transport system substrate-binding protein